MAVLWAAATALTTTQVQAELAQNRTGTHRAVAYNTVQTILIRLLEKGLVQRRAAGRGHVYWPVQSAVSAAATQMRAVLDGPADRRAVLQQFTDDLDDDDAAILRALLDRDEGAP
jgi:predicted transcriptional regulator